MSGLHISALYTLRCDHCGVRAEPVGTDYRSRSEAVDARERLARFEGWLLRRIGVVDEFRCPECAALSE